MLKIIKYDLKSTGIIMTVMCMAALVINVIFWCILSNADAMQISGKLDSGGTFNVICYCIFVITIVGNMWRRMNSNTELFEMAGVSALKVGAARMLTVFVSVSLFAILLTLGENILFKIYNMRVEELASEAEEYIYIISQTSTNETMFSMFAVNNMRWTNIFTPLFAGLYASILFTTSFLFATVNRRFKNMFASSVLLAGVVVLVLVLNFGVLNKINLYVPELNLNKLGVGGLIIERFGSEFGNIDYNNVLYMLNPNMLNMGFLLFQSLYVGLMFSVYSIRRKAI
ncbi:MAG: hypothetical protein EOM87_05275 [Clostridia bacterium]|nr:hypothetical protein [Clostridia bacterium]